MTQEPAPTACVVRECHCWLTAGAGVTATFLAFSASFPPTWPSIAIIPDTDVVALPGAPSPVRNKSPGTPGAAPPPQRGVGGSVPAPVAGLEEGSVLYRGSITTDLLHPSRCSHLPIATALQSVTSRSKGKNSAPCSSDKPGTNKLTSVGETDPAGEEFAGKLR